MRVSSFAGFLAAAAFVLIPAAAHSQWTVTYLQPATTTDSFGRGVPLRVDQVGQASTGGIYHAALWTGSAGSYVDLQPAGPVAFA